MDYKIRIIYNKHCKEWMVVDPDGWSVAGYKTPAKARKAKLYWWLYLTQDHDHMKYLDKMAALNELTELSQELGLYDKEKV